MRSFVIAQPRGVAKFLKTAFVRKSRFLGVTYPPLKHPVGSDTPRDIPSDTEAQGHGG